MREWDPKATGHRPVNFNLCLLSWMFFSISSHVQAGPNVSYTALGDSYLCDLDQINSTCPLNPSTGVGANSKTY